MSAAEPWTIGRLLGWTQEYLSQRGADSPRLDAEVLLAQARGCRRIELYTAFDEQPPESVRNSFRELVRRRAEGMPVAYLVGRREFYSLDFLVTPDVLIPRPESEFLVIAAIDALKARGAPSEPARVLDVGTGSGCLAVSLAKHWPGARVTACDISPAALAVAASNAARHAVADQIRFVESDLCRTLPADEVYDLVLSNPPYVSSAEYAQLATEVARYEPRLALEAGPTGLELITRLVAEAAERLRPGGWLLCEISPQLEASCQELFAAQPAWQWHPPVKDLAGLTRVVVAERRGEPSAPGEAANGE